MLKRVTILGLLLGIAAFALWGCSKNSSNLSSEGGVAPPPMATPPEAPAATPESGSESGTDAANITYTCPMHPDVQQDKPGKCPKCGMFLQAKAPEGTKVTYICPMHPEVKRDKPGKCSECGMFLEAKIGHAHEGHGHDEDH